MCDCSKEHEEIEKQLRDIAKTLEYHTAEVHSTLVNRDEIQQFDAELDETIKAALLGPLITDGIHKGTRVRELGIEYKVNEMWTAAFNGGQGIKTRLSRRDKIALYGPTVGALAVVVAAAVGVF